MTEKNKTTTVRDLKTFIEAVEFASDQDEWIPSARQWKRIREMISNLEETPQAPVMMHVPAPPQQQFDPRPAAYVQPAAPSFATPAAPSSLAPSYGPNIQPSVVPATQVPPSFGTPRTPDIDTSSGQYKSSFA